MSNSARYFGLTSGGGPREGWRGGGDFGDDGERMLLGFLGGVRLGGGLAFMCLNWGRSGDLRVNLGRLFFAIGGLSCCPTLECPDEGSVSSFPDVCSE